MTAIEETRKLRHPFYRIIELPENDLINRISNMSREEIINWLQWNDRNGLYLDNDSLCEFGIILKKEEGVKIMLGQILGR